MISTPHVDWFSISTILVLLGASFVALLSAVLVLGSALIISLPAKMVNR